MRPIVLLFLFLFTQQAKACLNGYKQINSDGNYEYDDDAVPEGGN